MVRVLTNFGGRHNRVRRAHAGVVLALLVGAGALGASGWAPAQTGDSTTTLDPALDTLPPYIEPTTTTRATLPPVAPTTTTSTMPPWATTGDLSGVCASIAPRPGAAIPTSLLALPSVAVGTDAGSSDAAVPAIPDVPGSEPTPAPVPSQAGCRLVAYYGNPTSPGLGPMGQSPPPQMLSALTALTQRWQEADPQTATRCALQLIAVVAQGSPGAGSLYRGRASAATINKVISWGRERGCLTILDVQVGWSNVPAEVAYLERWLAMPDVHLALDPEWDMQPGAKPGSRIGTMSAADINSAIAVLDRLAVTNGLGPRMLIVHRFRSFMVTDPQMIKPTPNIRLVVNMDGFGPVAEKLSSYRVAQKGMPTGLTGWKLFFKLDRPLLGPGEVVTLKPAPVFVNYQ
jgi:hypothetical protein